MCVCFAVLGLTCTVHRERFSANETVEVLRVIFSTEGLIKESGLLKLGVHERVNKSFIEVISEKG